MRKNILIIATVLCLTGCGHETENKIEKEEHVTIDLLPRQPTESLSNPAFMKGSDFLNVFKRFYINQDFSSMLIFTSEKSKKRFGEKYILEFYKQKLELGFDVKLKSIKFNPGDSTCILNYQANIFATKQTKAIECIIENDTVKIYLDNLRTIFVSNSN